MAPFKDSPSNQAKYKNKSNVAIGNVNEFHYSKSRKRNFSQNYQSEGIFKAASDKDFFSALQTKRKLNLIEMQTPELKKETINIFKHQENNLKHTKDRDLSTNEIKSHNTAKTRYHEWMHSNPLKSVSFNEKVKKDEEKRNTAKYTSVKAIHSSDEFKKTLNQNVNFNDCQIGKVTANKINNNNIKPFEAKYSKMKCKHIYDKNNHAYLL